VCVGTASIFDGNWEIAFEAVRSRFRSLGYWIASALSMPDKGDRGVISLSASRRIYEGRQTKMLTPSQIHEAYRIASLARQYGPEIIEEHASLGGPVLALARRLARHPKSPPPKTARHEKTGRD
jgi:hypothetical protein